MLAPHLQKLGYKSFLKLHSKRSTHRTDGEDWFSTILNGLVPSDKSLVKATLAKLDDPKTGIICPENQYVSLRVNYRANQHHVNGLIADATSEVTQRKLDSNVGDYGFAAGTMFWARFDAIKSLLSRYTARNFETEQGQIDGTFAHALERVFTVLPELNGLNIYEIGESSLERIQYDSGIVPDWSDIHKPRG
jgi:lipopolysaccharide biosynthesis protein